MYNNVYHINRKAVYVRGTAAQCVLLRRHGYAAAGGAGVLGCFSAKPLHLNKANGP